MVHCLSNQKPIRLDSNPFPLISSISTWRKDGLE